MDDSEVAGWFGMAGRCLRDGTSLQVRNAAGTTRPDERLEAAAHKVERLLVALRDILDRTV